jgi:hypothetical protein
MFMMQLACSRNLEQRRCRFWRVLWDPSPPAARDEMMARLAPLKTFTQNIEKRTTS